jgi:predicted Zn-dependent protease
LAGIGLHQDAIGYFSRAAEIEPDDPLVLRHLSGCLIAADNRELALDLALRAHRLAPSDRATAHHATELLLRCDRCAEAVQLISAALAADAGDTIGYRLLSAAEMLCGRPVDALDAIDRALAHARQRRNIICTAAICSIVSPVSRKRPRRLTALPCSIRTTPQPGARS